MVYIYYGTILFGLLCNEHMLCLMALSNRPIIKHIQKSKHFMNENGNERKKITEMTMIVKKGGRT